MYQGERNKSVHDVHTFTMTDHYSKFFSSLRNTLCEVGKIAIVYQKSERTSEKASTKVMCSLKSLRVYQLGVMLLLPGDQGPGPEWRGNQ